MGKKEKIEVLVDGGKATPGPPLGPQLGPLGVNIPEVINEINRKTKNLEGMKVPVKVIVDIITKEFEIEVGTPPVAALIKKELSLNKGSSEPGKIRAGDLSKDQVKKIAYSKFGSDEERYVSQVEGTAKSMGITIDQGGLSEEERKLLEESHAKAKELAVEAAKPPEGEEAKPEEGKVEEGEERPEEGIEIEGKKPEGKEEKPEESEEEGKK
jgi:large subunit ribosomal protein L11